MRTLRAWARPHDSSFSLGEIEVALLLEFQPPLNLQSVVTPRTGRVKAARAVMVEEAKAWAAARGGT